MDRRTFLAAAGGSMIATGAGARQTDLQTRLETLRAASGIPALAGAIVTVDDVVTAVSGVRRAGAAEAATLSDRWHLGSNTKAMTAALFRRLVEQGRAFGDASVVDLFQDLEVDPVWTSVTVSQLLGHRAGVLDAAVMPVWMGAAWVSTDVRRTRTDLARAVLSQAPAGLVGTFSYSNAGYILAGAAIERITGRPWETVMETELFAPLGMDSAGFGAPLDGPWGHQGAALRPMDPTAAGSDNPIALGPAGTVNASLESYARFLRLFLSGGGGWVSQDGVRWLTTPLEGAGQSYARGWGVVQGAPWAGGGPAFVHDGSNTLWLTRAVVIPARGAAVVAAANAADPARPAIDGLTRALIEQIPA